MYVSEARQRRLSVAGRAISAVGAAMVVAWQVAAWWDPSVLTPLLPPGVTPSGEMRWWLLLMSLVPALPFLGAMAEAFRLFGLLGRGLAFTEAMPRSLQRLGYWALACAVASFVTPTLMGLVATAGAAEKQLVIRVGSGEITGLVIALLLLAFGHVMRDSLRLARENQEFV